MREWREFLIDDCPAYDLMQNGRCVASVRRTAMHCGARWHWYAPVYFCSSMQYGMMYDDAASAMKAAEKAKTYIGYEIIDRCRNPQEFGISVDIFNTFKRRVHRHVCKRQFYTEKEARDYALKYIYHYQSYADLYFCGELDYCHWHHPEINPLWKIKKIRTRKESPNNDTVRY